MYQQKNKCEILALLNFTWPTGFHSSSINEHISHEKNLLVAVRGGKKSPNSLAHSNLLTNCLIKPIYLINGQMSVNPIRLN